MSLRARAIEAAFAQRDAEKERQRQDAMDRYNRRSESLIRLLREMLGIRITEQDITRNAREGRCDRPVYIEDSLMFAVADADSDSPGVLVWSALCPGCGEIGFTQNVANGIAGIGRQLEGYQPYCGACLSMPAVAR